MMKVLGTNEQERELATKVTQPRRRALEPAREAAPGRRR